MLLNIAIAAFMMVATTAIHAGGMVLALRLFRSQRGQVQKTRIYQLAGTILLMFLVSVLEVPA
ncbi:MAG: hypothetical protein JJV98_14005 [Desulfosarcina sp.]|nr:hypothetical protein [Desulfobacterales bacterium]